MDALEIMELRLWEYIDGTCTPDEKVVVEKLIEVNAEWKEKYESILAMHRLMHNSLETDHPSMRFSKNVMDLIAEQQLSPIQKPYVNIHIIRGIAVFFIGTLAALFGYVIIHMKPGNSSSFDFGKPMERVFDFGSAWAGTGAYAFMFINCVMFLLFADRLLAFWRNKRGASF